MRNTNTGVFLLLTVAAFANSSKEQADTPKTRKADNGIDDTADDSIAAAKEPCYQVKTENADKAPVKRTDDRKDQSKSIHIVTSISFVHVGSFSVNIGNMRMHSKNMDCKSGLHSI